MLTLRILKSGWTPWLILPKNIACVALRLVMGGINFAWLAVWVPSPDWPRFATFFRSLGEATAPGGGEYGPCPESASYTLAFALQLRKVTENLSQGSRKALGWSAPNVIRLVDLAIAGDRLDWPADPCRPWLSRQATGSTLGQRKYLPSYHTRGFPTSAKFGSKLAVRTLMWSANSGTPRSSCICLLLTYQGAPVSRRRHLDCNTCSLRTWERAADLHAGHASWGGWAAYIAGLRSWRRDHSSCSGGDPACPSSEQSSF